MKRTLTVALIAVVLSISASFAEPLLVKSAENTAISGHDGFDRESVTDLTTLVGGERSHSCRTNAVAGAVLTATGLVLGSRWLSVIGGHLILLSETVCY